MQRSLAADISGLTRLATRFANAWLVDAPGGWVLVDTGPPGYAGRIVHHAERRYGRGTRPHAIVLTHGHIDHAGSAARLSRTWGVPVFAHRREIPYLDGQSAYPPAAPTIGGALAALARALPTSGHDLRSRLRPLPLDGHVPHLPGWTWLHTPGHTPGHVSLLRTTDRLLLSGDALSRPPCGFTTDWAAARASVCRLAALEPTAIAGGHGLPMSGPEVPAFLLAVADAFPRPARTAPGFPARRAAALGLLALGVGLAFRSLRRTATHA